MINGKFSQIGESFVKRILSSFRRTYQLSDKSNCLASAKLIAQLINQNIPMSHKPIENHRLIAVHFYKNRLTAVMQAILLNEEIGFEILHFLIRNISTDGIELTVGFLHECGKKLLQLNQHELDVQFKKLNDLLGESLITECIKNMIEKIFSERTNELKSYPVIQSNLKLVNENNQFKHMLQLDDYFESESWIDIFKFDEQYEVNEKQYHKIRKGIFEYFDYEFESSSNSSDSDEKDEDTETKQQKVTDRNDTDSITIQSNISAKECAKKLLKMNLYREQNMCILFLKIKEF
ncbi:unnamed protein product [Rotaria socialis]